MSAYCADCGVRAALDGSGTLVIRHADTCPSKRPTSGQLTKVVMQLRDLGIRDRDRRLAVVSSLVQVQLDTMRQLTARQAGLLIEELDHMLKSGDPVAELAAAVARADGLEPAAGER